MVLPDVHGHSPHARACAVLLSVVIYADSFVHIITHLTRLSVVLFTILLSGLCL